MSQLTVPIHDRRKRKRIVTLKNFGRFAIALAVVFAGLTIHSEMRKSSGDDYGRLFGKQVAGQVSIAKPKYDVIKEAPVSDQTAADPLLLEPAARSQYLGVESSTMVPASPSAPDSGQTALPVARGDGTAVVGGPNGVTIVRGKSEQRPVLAGGIFKQQ